MEEDISVLDGAEDVSKKALRQSDDDESPPTKKRKTDDGMQNISA